MVSAQRTLALPVWPEGALENNGDATDTAKIFVYLPEAREATGRAVVICPGGGYERLSMDSEGTDWAPFFNHQGIAAIVLKYRMPRGHKRVPASDVEQALRIVRQHAADWHLHPDDVGVMGFSAGGHLASTVATHAAVDVRPAFQILFYPVITMDIGFTHMGTHDNLLGEHAAKGDEREYSNDEHVTAQTPRAFIALADDDQTVQPINGVNYYTALLRNNVPATLCVYPSGGHGFGYRESFKYHLQMLLELTEWLRTF